MPGDLPNAVLFACTQNVIRSPMAAAIMKHLYGHKVYVASAGVRPGETDPFIATVLDEIGIDLGKHRPGQVIFSIRTAQPAEQWSTALR